MRVLRALDWTGLLAGPPFLERDASLFTNYSLERLRHENALFKRAGDAFYLIDYIYIYIPVRSIYKSFAARIGDTNYIRVILLAFAPIAC